MSESSLAKTLSNVNMSSFTSVLLKQLLSSAADDNVESHVVVRNEETDGVGIKMRRKLGKRPMDGNGFLGPKAGGNSRECIPSIPQFVGEKIIKPPNYFQRLTVS